MADNGWIEIKVNCATHDLDSVAAVMSMITNSLYIEDYSDVEELVNGIYGEVIEEELLKKDRSRASVTAYLSDPVEAEKAVIFARERCLAENIDVEIESSLRKEEEWSESWKQYYKPIKTGNRLVIVPLWEKYEKKDGEITVLMDPGMAFGTGTHETTRLCAAMLEKYINPGDKMLDVGCGSGILAICASKLGASFCDACDIDPVSVKVAKENTGVNGTPNVSCFESDLLSAVKAPAGGYDICTANIVADIIIRMAPDIGEYLSDDGVLIVSGIIEKRTDEVRKALTGEGFYFIDSAEENGWFCGVLKKNK